MVVILNELADFREKQLTENYHELSYALSNIDYGKEFKQAQNE